MRRVCLTFLLMCAVAPVAGWAYYRETSASGEMSAAAETFVKSLNEEQKKAALLSYENEGAKRLDWHFIPKDERKGLQLKHMTPDQRKAALMLLKVALSEAGYSKATQIMSIERLLHELETKRGGGRFPRDPERYYFTLFGANFGGRWGLSVEGHHLSLNFVVEDDKILSTTPQMLGANPAVVKTENKAGFPVGTRILAKEEQLGFDLINGLDEAQRKIAIIAEEAVKEIRAAGEPQPPTDPPAGIAAEKLNSDQQKILRALIEEYARVVPEEVAIQRLSAMDVAGFDKVHFAWAGALKPGVGHYYRIQGPTFVVEFVNTQPDSAGNPANHIHSVWRSMKGDFAIPLK